MLAPGEIKQHNNKWQLDGQVSLTGQKLWLPL